MRTVSSADIELDVCDRCHGVWLDPSEFEFLHRLKNQLSTDESQTDSWSFKCASCSCREMRQIDSEHGLVYRCTECFGVYVPKALIEPNEASELANEKENDVNWFKDVFGPLGYLLEGLASLK